MKDAGLRIRVQRELRDQFIEACRQQDVPAAQVLRDFMRGYILQHKVTTAQRDHAGASDTYPKNELGGE